MRQDIESILPKIIQIRHKLHQHPELSFAETTSMEIIRDALEEFGLSPQCGIGKTGIVCEIDSGRPGDVVGFRADFDALAIEEATDLPYASTNSGVMHACGHDGHAAILLCVAGVLANNTHLFNGKVICVFQPAEETGEGAQAMLLDDTLTRYPIDQIFALHNFPKYPAGQVTVKDGCVLAGMERFTITFTGVAGHASIPEACSNPITAAARFQMDIAEDIANVKDEDALAEINLTHIESIQSDSINVTPSQVTIKGVTRASSLPSQQRIRQRLEEKISSFSQDLGIRMSLNITHSCPPTINDTDATNRLRHAAKTALGHTGFEELNRTLATFDDFAYWSEQVPGCYFFIGNGSDSPMVHTAQYNFNDEIIAPAARVFLNLVIDKSL